MEEGRYRTVTLVLLAIAAFAAVGLLLLGLVPYFHGLSSNVAFVAGGVLLAVLVFLALLIVPERAVAYVARRRAQNSLPAPYDLARDLIAYYEQAKRLWIAGNAWSDSFSMALLTLMNLYNGKPDALDANHRIFAEQANGVVMGWRLSRDVAVVLASGVEGLTPDQMDTVGFEYLLGSVVAVATAGANTAENFLNCIANSGLVIPSYTRTEWNSFAGKADLLANNLETLGQKAATTFAAKPVHLPQVRTL